MEKIIGLALGALGIGYVVAQATSPTVTYDIYPLTIKNYDTILPTNTTHPVRVGTGSIGTGSDSTKLTPKKEPVPKKESVEPISTTSTKQPKNNKPQKKQITKAPTKKSKATRSQKSSLKKANIDKLAYAVAMQETQNCTVGYGATHNNCFGIKNYRMKSIAHLCSGTYKKMCKFKSKEDAYKAFKIVWSNGYKGLVPNLYIAKRRSGNDRANARLMNVLYYYNK